MTRPLRVYVSRWGVPFAAGLFAVLVPTLFTVFPAWGMHWSIQAKVGALVLWLLAATGAVVAAVRQGAQLDTLVREREQRGRTGAMERLIRVTLTPQSAELPADYHFQVFLPNPDRTLLTAEFDPERIGPPEGWRIDQEPPQAVTGAAWRTNSYVFAKGTAVFRRDVRPHAGATSSIPEPKRSRSDADPERAWEPDRRTYGLHVRAGATCLTAGRDHPIGRAR